MEDSPLLARLRRSLREVNPGMYRTLAKAGLLEKVLKDKEQDYLLALGHHYARGGDKNQAEDLERELLRWIPGPEVSGKMGSQEEALLTEEPLL